MRTLQQHLNILLCQARLKYRLQSQKIGSDPHAEQKAKSADKIATALWLAIQKQKGRESA